MLNPRVNKPVGNVLRAAVVLALAFAVTDMLVDFSWMPRSIHQSLPVLACVLFAGLCALFFFDALRYFRRRKDELTWKLDGKCPQCGYSRESLGKWTACP